MTTLVVGLLVFFAVHSVRIVADDWRKRAIARHGRMAWHGLHSVGSLLALVLIVYGYAQARATPLWLWPSPPALRHAAVALMVVAAVLLAAAFVPRNAIKARLHHPLVMAIEVWAFAHLLANGTLADLLLFGSFLAWALALHANARGRDRAEGRVFAAGRVAGSLATVGIGLLLWAVFALWLHAPLIGVAPLAI